MQTELDQFDNMTPSLTLEPELEAAPVFLQNFPFPY